jgi:REP element-mobilizing transposase RayT
LGVRSLPAFGGLGVGKILTSGRRHFSAALVKFKAAMPTNQNDSPKDHPGMQRIEEKAGTYFITFSLKERNHALNHVERCIVFKHILSGHKERYLLYAVAVMADHVHLIFQARNEEQAVPLPPIMKWVKGVSARLINQSRERSGSLWEERYHNQLLFTEKYYYKAMEYVADNPVHHGETAKPDDFPFLWYQGRGSMSDALKRLD